MRRSDTRATNCSNKVKSPFLAKCTDHSVRSVNALWCDLFSGVPRGNVTTL
jgi:hypothetical protein